MTTTHRSSFKNENGIALVTTLMLSLLLSILVAGMLLASTSDTLIGGNDVRNNQAFYIAEAGINRAAGWFTARFGSTPSSGLFVLPEKYLGANWKGSNTEGAVGKLSYTTGEANYLGSLEAAPYYKPGVLSNSSQQTTPTSVKTLVNGNLQNVMLAGDSTNTYPPSYTVNGLNAAGAPTPYTYTNVISDFTSSLVNQQVGDGTNQQVGEGTFTVTAILVSILPPNGTEDGMATWLLKSEGKLTRGTNTSIASATVWAYMSALVTKVQGSRTVESTTQVVNADPGVVSRGMVLMNSTYVTVDSYKSSKGLYGAALAANTFPDQIGAVNKGSRGDVRSNNEFINGAYGYLNITGGVVTGRAFATFTQDGFAHDAAGNKVGNVLLPPPPGPILIDDQVNYTKNPTVVFNSLDPPRKFYALPPLIFPDIAVIPNPTGNTYNYATNASATLPSGNWNNLNISKGQLTVPGGTYGTLDLSAQGKVVLGTPGQTTTYNFQGFSTGAQTRIIYAGPVVINVKSSLDIGGQGSISDLSTPASAIHWNFKGGNGEIVYVGGGGDTVGVFYAPNNDLEMRGGGDFYGAVAAKSVQLKGNGAFHIDEDAVLPVTTTQQVIVTTVITVGYTGSNYSLWRITQHID